MEDHSIQRHSKSVVGQEGTSCLGAVRTMTQRPGLLRYLRHSLRMTIDVGWISVVADGPVMSPYKVVQLL